MVRNDWEWLEMVKNCQKLLEMVRNGLMSRTNSGKRLAKVGNNCKWLQMTVNGWEW